MTEVPVGLAVFSSIFKHPCVSLVTYCHSVSEPFNDFLVTVLVGDSVTYWNWSSVTLLFSVGHVMTVNFCLVTRLVGNSVTFLNCHS